LSSAPRTRILSYSLVYRLTTPALKRRFGSAGLVREGGKRGRQEKDGESRRPRDRFKNLCVSVNSLYQWLATKCQRYCHPSTRVARSGSRLFRPATPAPRPSRSLPRSLQPFRLCDSSVPRKDWLNIRATRRSTIRGEVASGTWCGRAGKRAGRRRKVWALKKAETRLRGVNSPPASGNNRLE